MRFCSLLILFFLTSCTPGAPEAIIDSIELTVKLKNAIDKLDESTAEMKKLNKEIQEQLDNYESPYTEEELRIGDSLRKVFENKD